MAGDPVRALRENLIDAARLYQTEHGVQAGALVLADARCAGGGDVLEHSDDRPRFAIGAIAAYGDLIRR